MKVGLVQINNSFSGQNYLPYSVGLLQSYCRKFLAHPGRFEFQMPLHTRIPVGEAVERLEDAGIVFFSTYVWNIRISLEIARRLKARHPETLVVFGGPQVPDRALDFMAAHPQVDLACHGEGERVALKILESAASRNWSGVPSITWRDGEGEILTNPRLERLKEISTIPSPYLDGTFDALMSAHPDEHWIILWETNRGCPFSCTFCDWGSAIAAKVMQFDLDRLSREIEWFAGIRAEYIFCCDANFGILPRDVEIARFVAETKAARGYPHALSVQNTKNVTERAYAVQKILADAGLNKGVDIALQSIDSSTLKAIKRDNISSDAYLELQRRFTRDKVETYTDLILGLPGETYDSFADGASFIIQNGQHNRIQFNNCSILPNAAMGDPAYRMDYGIETVQSRIVNVHGSLVERDDDVVEMQEVIIATASMPRADWVRARVFSWMAALLHFDKVLQIPIILIHETTRLPYREIFEIFAEGDLGTYPTLRLIRDFFVDFARSIQAGGPEYVHAPQWLDVWWPADEFILIKLCREDRLAAFYAEARAVLREHLAMKRLAIPGRALEDAIRLNDALLKRPFQAGNLRVRTDYNIWEFYQAAFRSEPIPLEARACDYDVDRSSKTWTSWDDWCREVIWWGNKKGAYLYPNSPFPEPDLEGHF
jgi:radical SAM superfamily enzyme YgiQ (UPF0313 family)